MINARNIWLQVLFLILGMFLAACGRVGPDSTPGPDGSPTATAQLTDTPMPSPTLTQASPLAVLLAPPGADAELVDVLQPVLFDLATDAGLDFQLRQELNPSDLEEELRIVVSLPPDPGLADIAARAPDVQFLAINIPGLEPSQNLSLIGSQGRDPGRVGFLAGYIAAVVTTDWRVGVISQAGDLDAEAARLGFENGAVYFCGLCRPVYPPFPTTGYPLGADLPPEAGQADWDAALGEFNTWQVGTVYLAPAVVDDARLADLAQRGINIIGQGAPPADLRDHWVASISRVNPIQPLQELWPSIINGEGGMAVELELSFSEANEDLFSPGKQRLVEEMLEDLNSGFIDPGVN